MTNKEKFIAFVENLMEDIGFNTWDEEAKEKSGYDYWLELKTAKEDAVTDKGKPIIAFMQERYAEFNNLFKAKDIGEGIGVSSRSVSGSLKKLVTDGYVEKVGKEPTVYALTEKGSNTVLDKN